MHPKIARSRAKYLNKLYMISLISAIYGVAELILWLSILPSEIIFIDMLHSFLDALMSFATGFAIYLSLRSFSKKFSNGLYKIENMISLMISLITMFLIAECVYDSVFNIQKGSLIPIYVPIIFAAGSLVSFVAYKIELRIARKTRSMAVLADAQHARSDFIFGIFTALLSLAGSVLETIYIEKIIVMIMSVYIGRDAIFITKDSLLALLDASPDERFVSKIMRDIKRRFDIEIESIDLRKTGSFITGVITVKLDPEIKIRDAEIIIRRIRRYLYRRYPELINIVIKPVPTAFYKKDLSKILTKEVSRRNMPPRGFEPLTARYLSEKSSAGRSPS